MDRLSVMILAVMAAIAVCLGALMVMPGDPDAGEEFGIEYDLGQGSGHNANPSSYRQGDSLRLAPCSYEDGTDTGILFGGWYLDPSFEELFMEITPETSGDLKLYAKWQDDFVGKSFTLDFSGTVKDGIFNTYGIRGSQTSTYVCYSEEKECYYVTYDSSMTYDYGIMQYTDSDSWGEWNVDDGKPVTVIGQERIDTMYGPKDCYIVDYADTTQWIGLDDGTPYRIQVESEGILKSVRSTYTLSCSTVVPVVDEIEVTAYADAGITVTGSGTYRPTDSPVLTAVPDEGTVFDGWYDSLGNLLTRSATYSPGEQWNDVEVYAMNDRNPDYVTETFSTTAIDLGSGAADPRWSIHQFGHRDALAEGASDTLEYTFEETGLYEIYITGSDGYHGYRTLEIEGDVVRIYQWKFENRDYECKLTMDYSKVQEYRNRLPVDERHFMSSFDKTFAHEKAFVTYDDPYIMELASKLNHMSSGMNDVQKANFVLAFLQSIEYQSDEVFMGAEEYWKFPVETLYDMGGDCEDSSILYSAIVKAMGYDTALLLMNGHMMSAVHVDGKVTGKYVTIDGEPYYFVESTSDNARIGYNPNDGLKIIYTIPI